MDLGNDVRTVKRDPRNQSAFDRSKNSHPIFAVCGPNLNKLSAHAQEVFRLLQRHFPSDDMLFRLIPDVIICANFGVHKLRGLGIRRGWIFGLSH